MHQRDRSLETGALFEERYEILALLGEGGFGLVYKARQRTTGQPVALKLMRMQELRGAGRMSKQIARFLREAELCAQLHHPNIVSLIDSGQTGDGLLYMVFAFAPGETLADLLAREGALAPREAQHLMLQVLDALTCAHACGVVHRDLKPSNIMVIPTGARRNALVLDFGIGAITAGEPGEEATRLTATDETLGTPGYAAPEQLRGLDPSPRADLFAWGLVFLECLTGTPVYRGSSAAEIVYQQLARDPVPIPVAIERHRLGDLLRRATHKAVDEREATAKDLFEALLDCDLRGLSKDAMARGEPLPASAAHTGALSASWLANTEATPGQTMLEGERRHVNAICCILSTRAAADRALDVEEADGHLRASLAECAELASRHRGHVATALGDRVLLYFGYLHAEEDDAPRAARAALQIAERIRTEGERSAASRGVRVDVRIGIHSGLVVAGDQRGEAGWDVGVGSTPTIAARLAAQAPPGAALVSVDTQRLLRATFELEAEGARSAEGIDERIPAFRLQRERSERESTPTPDSPKAPLVGREQEMELLLERWRRARDGAGQCSLITGEPGIGKSRLVYELRGRLHDQEKLFLEGRCSPDAQNNALYPIVELLLRALSLEQEPSLSAKIARLEERLAHYGLETAKAMPLFLPLFALPMGALYAPLDVPPQRQKELTHTAVISLLFAMTEERPVLLLIEDLHWADPTTLELLTQIVREAPSAPMCVLLTARPEFSPSFPTTGMLQLHLSRLERPQVEAMVAELMGKKALATAVLEQVASRTDGVPLFVEELTRMMVESGVLLERGDHFELEGTLSDVKIPGTLRALLTARLDRLGRAKETAQIAAALGREFSVDILSAVSPLGVAAVQEDLDRLTSAGLVFRKRRLKDPVCVFKHALIRDAAYESLPQGARKRVHAGIARTLEERFPEVVATRPDRLAHHHAAADQKREALGYAQRAAQGALQRSANAEALGYAQEAMGWLSAIESPRERLEMELAMNGLMTPALMATKGYAAPEVEPLVRRSQEIIEVLGKGPYTFPTLWALMTYRHTLSQREEARTIAEQMVALAQSEQDPGLHASALVPLGSCLWVEGRYEPAREALSQALSLCDANPQASSGPAYAIDTKPWGAMSLAPVLWCLGRPDQAVRYAEDALAWGRELKHTNTIGLAYLYLSSVHYYNGDRERTIETTRDLFDFATQHGLAFNEAYGRILHGWATRSLDPAKKILDDHHAAGLLNGITFYGAAVAELLAALGRHEEALERVDRYLQIGQKTGERYHLSALHRLRGLYLLERDPKAEDEAEACFRSAIEVARSQGARMFELQATSALCRLLQRNGRLDEARALMPAILDQFTEGFDTLPLKEARSMLREIAH